MTPPLFMRLPTRANNTPITPCAEVLCLYESVARFGMWDLSYRGSRG